MKNQILLITSLMYDINKLSKGFKLKMELDHESIVIYQKFSDKTIDFLEKPDGNIYTFFSPEDLDNLVDVLITMKGDLK